jgi:hypothetical protein
VTPSEEKVVYLPTSANTERRLALLERSVSNLRPLLDHLAREERRTRMCPLCRCEHVLEPHDEDCPYDDARNAVAMFDILSERVCRTTLGG